MEVVDAADSAGSTDFIKKAIAAATEPTTFAIGTEINMVNRLAAENPQHTIFCLDPVICPCSTMYRIHPATSPGCLRNSWPGGSSTASPWTTLCRTTPRSRSSACWQPSRPDQVQTTGFPD